MERSVGVALFTRNPGQAAMSNENNRGVSVITGATAGIGAEFAQRLAERGHSLLLVARNADRLAATSQALTREYGATVEILSADLATDAGLDAVVANLAHRPAIDLLINNAGFGTKGALASADEAGQDAMVRLHVLAVSRLTRSVLPSMVLAGRGAIITVSSVASYLTSAGNMNYCATKAYQRIAMEALAREVASLGVYVQALCPGLTHTEFHARARLRTEKLPEMFWMSAAAVVDCSLRALDRRGPTVVVPGLKNRAILALVRLIPSRLVSAAAAARPKPRA